MLNLIFLRKIMSECDEYFSSSTSESERETYEQSSEEVSGLYEPFQDEPLGTEHRGVVNIFARALLFGSKFTDSVQLGKVFVFSIGVFSSKSPNYEARKRPQKQYCQTRNIKV